MNYKKTKEQLNSMLKDNHKNFIKALISIETGINNQDDLDYIYNIYMRQDNFNLLNDEFDTIIEYSRIIDFKNQWIGKRFIKNDSNKSKCSTKDISL